MAQFAADAGPLHPYKADAPRGGKANGRAQVNYLFDTLEIANSSQEHWDDVEIWVNGAYVVHVPRIQGNAEETRRLSFWMLCDATGKAFPRGNTDPQNHIRKVEMLRNGTMYDIHLQLAD
jgi:hypothetical protein